MKNYKKRIVDEQLQKRLRVFGAVLIIGPKGCGKTTTAKQFSKSIVEFQDEERRKEYISKVEMFPSKMLVGENPRLFDEWQDAPKIWGAVRKSVDDRQEPGLYILTGSTSQSVDVPHTGTMRISRLEMMPMSLYESGESNGSVSLKKLFDSPDELFECHSDLDFDSLVHAICRGGWPYAVNMDNKDLSLEIAKDLFRQICSVDASHIDGIKRDPSLVDAVLKSYSRNICTEANDKTIIDDVKKMKNTSETTYYDYVKALEHLFVISDIGAWSPSIRSKTAIRSSRKKNLIDPSIAVAAMGIGPEYLNHDFETLGFLFESLCIRDLRIYVAPEDGKVSYYRDRYGLEVDMVLHLNDGRYALCEVKLGGKEIDKGAEHLLKVEKLIQEHNEKNEHSKIPLPTLKMIITGMEYGYLRNDGVIVMPIGCLRD